MVACCCCCRLRHAVVVQFGCGTGPPPTRAELMELLLPAASTLLDGEQRATLKRALSLAAPLADHAAEGAAALGGVVGEQRAALKRALSLAAPLADHAAEGAAAARGMMLASASVASLESAAALPSASAALSSASAAALSSTSAALPSTFAINTSACQLPRLVRTCVVSPTTLQHGASPPRLVSSRRGSLSLRFRVATAGDVRWLRDPREGDGVLCSRRDRAEREGVLVVCSFA